MNLASPYWPFFLTMNKFAIPLLLGVLSACSAPAPGNRPSGDGDAVGDGDHDPSGDGDGDTSTGSRTGGGDGDGDGAGGGDGDGDGAGGGPPLPDGTGSSAALPARIRRLTNAEYNASVQALLGTELRPADDFPPDARQHGYSLNEAARVDPVLARRLDSAALQLADEALTRIGQIAPCSDPTGQAPSCADMFIESFGQEAYRRPLTAEDRASLTTLYEAGSSGATYADGIHLVIRGVLQSPAFLYLTELGDGSTSGVSEMTSYEIAASLSYMLTGAPPDEQLFAAASDGRLSSGAERAQQAQRLLSDQAGRSRALRVIKEWLRIDRISMTSKDSNVYPSYAALQEDMGKESDDFILATLESSAGSVEELLGATWTIASSNLASNLYGVSGSGRVDVPERPGLLNRAAFLAVHAHAHESAPVLRGTAMLRQIGCEDIELPTNLATEIVPPVPDPTKTTRQRFEIHSQDPTCAKCHDAIDPLGFAFEQFDGMGAFRDTEGSHPIDSSAVVAMGTDFDGSYPSSTELALAIASSEKVAECFARQLFRASAGEASGIADSEAAFIASFAKLEADDRKSIMGVLVALASSDIMTYRRAP